MAQHDNMAENKIGKGDHIVDHVVKVTDPSVEKYVLYTMFESFKRTVTFSNENKTNPNSKHYGEENPRFSLQTCSCPVANGSTPAKLYVV